MIPRWSRVKGPCLALLLVLLGVSEAPVRAAAQSTVTAGPNIIAGRVIGADGQPIADADVYVEQLKQRVRTSADGRFRFINVDNGKYTVGARSIGYTGQSTKVTVKDKGVAIEFKLARAQFSLPARITTANRGGLSGVIADTGLRPLRDVSIRVMGQTYDERTDSAGKFFIPIKPGQYMLRVELKGFARQLIGVTVPENEGRQVAAWMVPQKRSNPVEGATCSTCSSVWSVDHP